MAAAVTFVLFRIDELIVYVAGTPLLIAFLVAAGTYTWVLITSRSR
jgi:hypothetical protein